ncbi:MAG: amidohydrolase [Ignavibacteriae bacterium]|nr:amidohydrolase [Ignavibacteriota bacterium]
MRIIAMLFLLSLTAVSQQQQADIVFVNANVWTVNDSQPEAQAVAVLDGKILAVSTDAEVKRYIGAQTKVVDLKGRRMLPGFIDNHTHFMSGGFQLQSVDLKYANDEAEFARLIKERAEKYPDRWITGGDWDHDRWASAQLPTKELIDRYTTKTPAMVNRYDGHMALANTHALKLAGITKDTPDPPGGTIVKDPKTGEPTGVLKDEAMSAVYAIIPESTEEEMLEAARLALAEARRLGVTSIQDMSSTADLRTYETLKERGELTARFYCRLPISQWEQLAAGGARVPFGDEWICIGSLKAYTDGSLGSSTALFFEPFTSDPSTRGLAMDIVQDGRLEQWALAADKAGLQLSIHAIGDSANSLILDLYEKIIKTNPKWDRRFRIEHAQHLHPKDLKRFAELGVIASMQPYHAIDDGRWAEKRIGYERCKTTYAFKSLLDNKARLTFGSDWTVAPLNPLLGIYAAVTRRTLDGATPNGWIPEQKINVKQAVRAYTIDNAYAAFEENTKGSIEVGKLADLVVLSDDILKIDPVKIENVLVDMTVLGGKIIWERK